MPHDAVRLRFKIDGFQPDTIPMSRLAEYMADLATMLGEKASVHFVALEDGCAQLVHEVERTAFPKIRARTADLRNGFGPVEAVNAYRALNKKLALDNTFATWDDFSGGAEILEFPGARAPRPVEIAAVEQPGSIIGTLQGVGGKSFADANVPVHVDTGDVVYACSASKALAKELAPYWGEERKLDGVAVWQREESGAWIMKKFTIRNHEPVDTSSLSELVERLRAVPSRLSEIRDPWGELMAERKDEGEPH